MALQKKISFSCKNSVVHLLNTNVCVKKMQMKASFIVFGSFELHQFGSLRDVKS